MLHSSLLIPYDLPNLLLQKLPPENFTATAKVKFIPNRTEAYKAKDKVLGESAGMIMQGMDYAALKFVDTKEEGVVLQYVTCEKAEKGKAEKVVKQVAIKTSKQPQPYTVKYAVGKASGHQDQQAASALHREVCRR